MDPRVDDPENSEDFVLLLPPPQYPTDNQEVNNELRQINEEFVFAPTPFLPVPSASPSTNNPDISEAAILGEILLSSLVPGQEFEASALDHLAVRQQNLANRNGINRFILPANQYQNLMGGDRSQNTASDPTVVIPQQPGGLIIPVHVGPTDFGGHFLVVYVDFNENHIYVYDSYTVYHGNRQEDRYQNIASNIVNYLNRLQRTDLRLAPGTTLGAVAIPQQIPGSSNCGAATSLITDRLALGDSPSMIRFTDNNDVDGISGHIYEDIRSQARDVITNAVQPTDYNGYRLLEIRPLSELSDSQQSLINGYGAKDDEVKEARNQISNSQKSTDVETAEAPSQQQQPPNREEMDAWPPQQRWDEETLNWVAENERITMESSTASSKYLFQAPRRCR